MKKAISIRLDRDIIDFFKSEYPEGYQVGISSILRATVDEKIKARLISTGRAKEIYINFHSQCFWHMKKDLEITPELLPLVIDGLRKYGGATGFKIAAELESN